MKPPFFVTGGEPRFLSHGGQADSPALSPEPVGCQHEWVAVTMKLRS